MNALAATLQNIGDWVTLYITMGMLVGTGLYLTIRTRAVQIRHFPAMVRSVWGSRSGAHGGISSFQAFTISLAARVGIGNVFGVAAALILGGPGAIFWMWVVALVGMATAFFEATLAQLFKERHGSDNTFRGGPAFYMSLGLKNRPLGLIFAGLTIFTCGFSIIMVQSNAIAGVIGPDSSVGASPAITATLLVALSAPVILGGVKQVARVTEIMAPVMAVIYLLLGLAVVMINIHHIPTVVATIVTAAFGPQQFAGGVTGSIIAALINGTRRGLFSNEAGQGTAPNAAATATVAHPVQQGYIQSLGVFVDTIVVCSMTAFIILSAGPEVYTPGQLTPASAASLTQEAVAATLGQWTAVPMALVVFVLAFSSVIAAATYSEVNMDFITSHPSAKWLPRVLSVVSTALGALATLELVWSTVDIMMAIMTVTNLVALLVLAPWGIGALRDFESQRRNGVKQPVFTSTDNEFLPAQLPTDVWVAKNH
ncbi:alanine/glycine:cation symporter family protein [Actinomyces vulturis]|uniref:alanine/glycine:cation symporter family protein n=1 Tax=Actinomyces vulturis TaxID=1857645 RepID=UPI000836C495|nr:alanine/glycine:cation symporter family protein [Actinomyces vulturis]